MKKVALLLLFIITYEYGTTSDTSYISSTIIDGNQSGDRVMFNIDKDSVPPKSPYYYNSHNFENLIPRVVSLSVDTTGMLTGFIDEWMESTFEFRFYDYTSVASGITAWWSKNTSTHGWFYGVNSSTEVAHVTGITEISEITDASTYSYSDWSVGPVGIGDIVLFHNTDTDYYAALRVNLIFSNGNLLNTSWYFQADGTADFSSFSPVLASRFFTENPRDGVAPYTTQFTDISIVTDSTENISWAWDFDNDGIIDSEEQNPSLIYEEGNYTVSLTVSDAVDSSTYVKEDYISVFGENTTLFVFVDGLHEWSVEPVFTHLSIEGWSACGSCFQWGNEDFDQTWGPLPVPQSKVITFSYYDACNWGGYNLYVFDGPNLSSEGTLIYSVIPNGASYCSWVDTPELDISFLTEETFFLRINNHYSNTIPVVKFRVESVETIGIGGEPVTIPKDFVLYPNYPNPFNPTTTLKYDLPEDALVNITIYDMMGRQVKTLINDEQTAGYRFTQWNATNNADSPVSAGIYLYMIQAGEFRQTKKMVLLK